MRCRICTRVLVWMVKFHSLVWFDSRNSMGLEWVADAWLEHLARWIQIEVAGGFGRTGITISTNRGLLKQWYPQSSSILVGFSLVNQPFLGYPYFRKPPNNNCSKHPKSSEHIGTIRWLHLLSGVMQLKSQSCDSKIWCPRTQSETTGWSFQCVVLPYPESFDSIIS